MYERGAAIINASVARALIRAQAMTAENLVRVSNGQAPAYGEDQFLELIDAEGIGHNAVYHTLLD